MSAQKLFEEFAQNDKEMLDSFAAHMRFQGGTLEDQISFVNQRLQNSLVLIKKLCEFIDEKLPTIILPS